MIVCHRHKFIFLKTSKTAGTSIELALSKFCGDEDIITPNSPDSGMRRELGHRGFQNCLAPWWDYRPRDITHLFVKRQLKLRFYDHMPAKEIRPLLEERMWSGYFKFCVERNPWDRAISLYHWRYRSRPKPPLAEFLSSDAPLLRLRQSGFELYTLDGEIAVDRICLYEDLQDGLEEVRIRLGLPAPLELPRANSTSRTDRRHYRELLDEEQRERIRRVFQPEIELFGYEF
jgi:hypothetical protein